MDSTVFIKKLCKNKIKLEELDTLEINYDIYDSININYFIENYQCNEDVDDILILLNGLKNIGFKFTQSHFESYLADGKFEDIIDWYMDLGNEFNEDHFILDAAYSIEKEDCLLEALLQRNFNPNFEGIDIFWFDGHYDGGYESCCKTYYLLLKYGYKFQNPLMFCMLVGSISCMFKERFEFDIEEFFNFPEIKKYMEMEYIEIKDEHLREFLKLEYFHKCENLDQYFQDLGFMNNPTIKWPKIIITIDKYVKNEVDIHSYGTNKLEDFQYAFIGFEEYNNFKK